MAAIPRKGDKAFAGVADIEMGMTLLRVIGFDRSYAKGFKDAADTLVGSILGDDIHLRYQMAIPACYLYRHYLELEMKYALIMAGKLKVMTVTVPWCWHILMRHAPAHAEALRVLIFRSCRESLPYDRGQRHSPLFHRYGDFGIIAEVFSLVNRNEDYSVLPYIADLILSQLRMFGVGRHAASEAVLPSALMSDLKKAHESLAAGFLSRGSNLSGRSATRCLAIAFSKQW